MSQETDIFLNQEASFESLVEAIANFLGIVFEKLDLEVGSLYRSYLDDRSTGVRIYIEVFSKHSLEDDGDLHFTEYEYEYEISLESHSVRLSEFDLVKMRHDLSWRILDALAPLLVGEAIVVENLGTRIHRNVPYIG